jgi:15-cis-phytoene synthase
MTLSNNSSFASIVRVTPEQAESLRYCQRVTKAAKSSFPLAFWVLPRAKRQAMAVLYAFFRLTDDLADQPGETETKRRALQLWRSKLELALQGVPSHPIHSALQMVVQRYSVPAIHLQEVIDGVEMDLDPLRFGAFFELYRYCYRVASAVGLSCLPVWGFRKNCSLAEAREPAEAAGIAFQLTNILRDLGEDLSQGRVYLPMDELQRFHCLPEQWREPSHAAQFQELMHFQVSRAKSYYAQSERLNDYLSGDGRAIFAVMKGLYRGLLDEIERHNFAVFEQRIRLSKRTKFRIMLRSWPVKWGLI